MATVKEMIGEEKVNKIADRLAYLKSRWGSEKGYEDFSDYIDNIASLLPRGATRVELSKKFKLSFDLKGNRLFFLAKGKNIAWGQEGCN